MSDQRAQEISKRRERARREKPHIQRTSGDEYFGTYLVCGSADMVYEVEVALEHRRLPTCTCRDYAVNRLGTCKHIEAVRLFLAQTPQARCWRDPIDLARGPIDELDVVVFDLETQRLFSDVGGRANIKQLGLSLAVVYSMREDAYISYYEEDAEALVDRLSCADLVVGYNALNFDYPVLERYDGWRLYRVPVLDMMLLVAEELGFRVSLDSLAGATLGQRKTADGLQAVDWYRAGRLDLVEEYCRADVELTAELFHYGRQHGRVQCHLRNGSLSTVRALWQAAEMAVG